MGPCRQSWRQTKEHVREGYHHARIAAPAVYPRILEKMHCFSWILQTIQLFSNIFCTIMPQISLHYCCYYGICKIKQDMVDPGDHYKQQQGIPCIPFCFLLGSFGCLAWSLKESKKEVLEYVHIPCVSHNSMHILLKITSLVIQFFLKSSEYVYL